MAKFNKLLNLRLKHKDNQKEKVTALAERSNSGQLSGFSGVFRLSSLSEHEKEQLKTLLQTYSEEEANIEEDFNSLIALTSEVKAITNQAIILHGERIKRAQTLLKSYKEGAFTAWLLTTYGNRQTPYNFLQYYEFYSAMPPHLQPKVDKMPRQAIYTLASRPGDKEEKKKIVETYEGQTKQEILTLIRQIFPLAEEDKRNPVVSNQVINALKKIVSMTTSNHYKPTEEDKKKIEKLLQLIKKTL